MFEIGDRVIGRRGIEAEVKEIEYRGIILMLRLVWMEPEQGLVGRWLPAEEVQRSGRLAMPPPEKKRYRGRKR
jgi:hypothetical protein